MVKERKQYSPEFKLEMIKLVEEQGQKITDIVAQYGVGESTLKNWLRRYRSELQGKPLPTGKALTEEQRELQRLRKENTQLKLERDILNEEGNSEALLRPDARRELCSSGHRLYWHKTVSGFANRANSQR